MFFWHPNGWRQHNFEKKFEGARVLSRFTPKNRASTGKEAFAVLFGLKSLTTGCTIIR